MNIELLIVSFISLALHLLGIAVLVKHRRHVRHHRFTAPTIGRDPAMTEALHARLSAQQPQSDWLCPYAMNAKITAWQRKERESLTPVFPTTGETFSRSMEDAS